MEREQCLGPGGVQLRQVEQGRTAQGAGDLAILPAGLGAAFAVSLQLGGPDQGHVPHLAGEGDAVIGKTHQGGELLDVVVLSRPHVAAHGQMQRYEALQVLPPHRLHLGEAIQHAQVHVVGVGLGDLAGPLGILGGGEALQFDRLALSRGVGEGDGLGSHQEASFLDSEALIHQVSMPCRARLRRRAARVPSTMAWVS